MQNLHPPSVQFKLYQGEVLRRGLYQELGGIHPSLQRFVPGTGCNPPIPSVISSVDTVRRPNRIVVLRRRQGTRMAADSASELERLVGERLQAELHALTMKFTLCFVAILCALSAAALFWSGVKRQAERETERRRRKRLAVRQDREDASPVERRSSGSTRAARHLLRHRVVRAQLSPRCSRPQHASALVCMRVCASPALGLGMGREHWRRTRFPRHRSETCIFPIRTAAILSTPLTLARKGPLRRAGQRAAATLPR